MVAFCLTDIDCGKENFRGQSKYLLCWRNEGNFSVLSSNLFSCDASRTMSAGGGSEKWPKFVHFCLGCAPHEPHNVLHTSLPLLMINGALRAAMPSDVLVRPDFKEGRSLQFMNHQVPHDCEPGTEKCKNWRQMDSSMQFRQSMQF